VANHEIANTGRPWIPANPGVLVEEVIKQFLHARRGNLHIPGDPQNLRIGR
jgi:hypothetical protein